MKKRYLYALLFGLPGLFVAGIISILGFAALTGFLWLFVFGDNPWPAYADWILSSFFALAVLLLWTIFIVLGYFIGRSLEKDPGLNSNSYPDLCRVDRGLYPAIGLPTVECGQPGSKNRLGPMQRFLLPARVFRKWNAA